MIDPAGAAGKVNGGEGSRSPTRPTCEISASMSFGSPRAASQRSNDAKSASHLLPLQLPLCEVSSVRRVKCPDRRFYRRGSECLGVSAARVRRGFRRGVIEESLSRISRRGWRFGWKKKFPGSGALRIGVRASDRPKARHVNFQLEPREDGQSEWGRVVNARERQRGRRVRSAAADSR